LYYNLLVLVALYIVEEHEFEHEFVDGVPVAIFKKMTEGEKCQSCWDKVMKKVTRSNCKECHGTGFTGGGYFPPVMSWMKFEPDPKIVQIADWGEKQIRQTDIQFTNFPLFSVGDIIVELKPNRYFRVSNVRFTEKSRVVMLQVCRLDEINRSDIEYDLIIQDELREPLIQQLEDRRGETEF